MILDPVGIRLHDSCGLPISQVDRRADADRRRPSRPIDPRRSDGRRGDRSASTAPAGRRARNPAREIRAPPPRRGAAPCDRTPRATADRPLLVCHSHLRWDWVYQRPQHLLSPAGAALAGDRRGGADLRRPAARAWTSSRWPTGVTVLRPAPPADRDFDLGALVEDYVADGPGRPAAGPLVLLADVRPLRRPARAAARWSSTTAWTSWPTSPAPRPG